MNNNQLTFAKESLTIGTSATKLTTTVFVPSGGSQARSAVIQCTKAPVRYWLTGDTPTSTSGLILTVNSIITIDTIGDIGNATFIRDDDATEDAVLEVQYQR